MSVPLALGLIKYIKRCIMDHLTCGTFYTARKKERINMSEYFQPHTQYFVNSSWICNHCDWLETSHQPVADQSPTTKTFLRSIWSQTGFTCSKQNLLVIESSLLPSCNPRSLSATSRQPPCYPPATSL